MAYNLKRKGYSEKYNKTSSVPSPSQPLSGLPGRGVSVSQSRAVTVTKLRFFLWFPLCHLPHVGYSPCDHIVAAAAPGTNSKSQVSSWGFFLF